VDLYLMQHGEALPEEADPQRALSGVGKQQALAAGAALACLGVELDRILSSPKKRAHQTAQAVAKALCLPSERIATMTALAPLTPPEETVEALKALGESASILLAGHLPSLAEVAAYLMDCQRRIAFRMGGVGCIEVERWGRGGGRLLWYLTPEQIQRIAAMQPSA
jgi:phosphohistidine phosphatase